ncbi:unnamed protein product [Eruca vesicaria subsp. sativa]|uniref:RNase H type-1 domain-containing protein n=1 Tax=Eruca vesicaria subsp. sativa TaxID=29727 RepID=A0ABC8LPS0_ERUVS|nr:unnamed protein product [Eruca vesicaria subsp. sativa]
MDSSRSTRNFAKKDCIIEFDGASKGNPGRAGAGAVIRDAHDNSVLHRVQEGLGTATNNVAEYRALNRGLEFALSEGYRNVQVQGDSQLVCKQVRGEWKANHPQMAELRNQARELGSQFNTFDIQHIPRESNSAADAQANQAANLAQGERKYY